MYSPNFYREHREEPIYQLISENPFAVLMTTGGEQISHLPLLLENTSGELSLLGHMARANPHWRELSDRRASKIVFQGPHGYISPAWYTPKADNVPTWNYAVAHVTGEFEVVEGAQAVFESMNKMVSTFESKYQTGWKLPSGGKEITELMKAIVVFRIRGLKFEAKFKLSQKQDTGNRSNVIAQLRLTENPELIRLAETMEAAVV